MLSNPPHASGIHARQRQHRRQNSTPTAFEAVKIAPLPTFQRPSPSHRRGLSLDTRRQQLIPTTPTTTTRQDLTTVSTSTTNTALATTPSQHVLRETQQQRIARPGPGQHHQQPLYPNMTAPSPRDSDAFILSPHGTPQNAHFLDALSAHGSMTPDLSGLSFDAYMTSMNSLMFKKNQAGFATPNGNDFDFFQADSALSTPTFMTFPDSSPAASAPGWISEGEATSAHSRRNSRRISNGIMDKVAKYESLGGGVEVAGSRPATPPNQNANGCFPPTPTETPGDRLVKMEAATPQQRPNRFSDGYDESMEETIKPVRGGRAGNRNSDIFQDFRQQAEAAVVQTPPRANTMPMVFQNQGLSTPEFMNMSNMNAEFVKIEHGFNALAHGALNGLSAEPLEMVSQMASQMPTLRPHNAFGDKPPLPPPGDFDSQATIMPPGSPSPTGCGTASPSRRGSPHRRTESIASIASAASIADINLDETKTDTGVTLDDIAAYIQGPDPSDGKWQCIYEDCNKRFGRKENIKSHVQTHLNDRQYQCPTCKKCFVRQHDLKRHAKIHTGIKPYPCECGNSFARHDALTRHRQRGMCIGAFDGIVRKVVKRGRPKKIRPDMDERREKSERTRRKNKHTSTSSVSSFSAYSDSSAANSPINDFEGMVDDNPFLAASSQEEMMHRLPATATMNPTDLGVSSAPMPSIGGGSVLSPTHHADSPSAMSNYSHASHVSSSQAPAAHALYTQQNLHPEQPQYPASPAKSVASHYTHLPGTPPELSASSSPPPTGSSARFFDLDPNSSGFSEIDNSIGLGTTAAAHAAAADSTAATPSIGCGPGSGPSAMVGLSNLDDMLLSFTNDGPVPLDHQSGMLLTKFEDDYDAVNMFTNNDDVFFGTS